MPHLRPLSALLLGFAAFSPLPAATLYSQPTSWTGNGSSLEGAAFDHFAPGQPFSQRAYDRFVLPTSASITQATWWGTYQILDGLGQPVNGDPNTAAWRVQFYADNSGARGASLLTRTFLPGQFTRTLIGTGIGGNETFNVYQFTVTFPAFSAAAATPYWFSPLSLSLTYIPTFRWLVSPNGDGFSVRSFLDENTNETSYDLLNADLAFQLDGTPDPTPIPEPSSALLFLSGLAALRLSFRRSK